MNLDNLLKRDISPCWILIDYNLKEVIDFSVDFLLMSNDVSKNTIERQVEIESYPNFLLIKAASNEITIDQIKKIHTFLANYSFIEGDRIVLIDGIDKMNRFASNSLLKICEETPSNTFIFGICERFHMIPATLRSRFQKLKSNKEEQKYDHEKIKEALILAYKDKTEELRAWVDRNVFEETENIVKEILLSIHNAALKKPNEKRLLDAYKSIENFENLSLNSKHYIFRCLLFLTNEK